MDKFFSAAFLWICGATALFKGPPHEKIPNSQCENEGGHAQQCLRRGLVIVQNDDLPRYGNDRHQKDGRR